MRQHHPPSPRAFVSLVTAAAGFAVLGIGWRLIAGEPHRPIALMADVTPADYVPEQGAAFALTAPDPWRAAPAPAPPAYGPPLDFLRVTSSFGMRRHPILGFTRMHQGVDFAAPYGAPVLASGDGIVSEADRDGGYGNVLRLSHAGGWATGYAHLSAFAPGIAVGARVARGEVIGFVGQTGLATGPHLHYEVSLNGVKLDPLTTPYGGAGGGPAAPAPIGPPRLQAAASPLHLRPEESLPGA
jgi:murein DD-endopeptidase MepM/ murein hydrolase activator NlpD